MQNLLIILIVAVCVYFIGRRLYNNLKTSQSGCGCGCSCSGCGPEISSACKQKDNSDTPQ